MKSDAGFLTFHALNFATTAWHVADWTWRHQVKNFPGFQAQYHCHTLAEFFQFVCSPDACPELGYCRDIANGSKALIVDPYRHALRIDIADGVQLDIDQVYDKVTEFWSGFAKTYGLVKGMV